MSDTNPAQAFILQGMAKMEPNEVMTIEEVAKYLKLKPQTVYKWAQEGQIPGAKFGKEWRFRRRTVDEWIDTTIALSKGGFDLMFQQSLLQSKRQGISRQEIEEFLKEMVG